MNTYLAYIIDQDGSHDETVWAESEEQARQEIESWYPNAYSIMISQYEDQGSQSISQTSES